MSTLAPDETVVMEGTFLYGGEVECDVRIVQSPVHYGTGDHEDFPEIADDAMEATFSIQYGSTTQRGAFNAGGGGYPSLAEAMARAEGAPGIGSSIRWKAPRDK